MKRFWLLLLVGGIVWASVYIHGALRQRTDAPDYTYERVSFGQESLSVWIDAAAEVRPRNRLQVRPPLGGRVEEVLVVEGEQVVQGQILAWISSTERAVLLDAARAQGVETLEHWMDIYRPTALVAPLDGTIIARRAEPGQTLTPADAPLVISDRLIVVGRVDETDIGSINVGQAARITLDAYPDVAIEGRVTHIGFEAQTVDNVIIYEVDVEIEEVPEVMRSGMTATVAFLVIETGEVLTLPADAVDERDAIPQVWLAAAPTAQPEPQPVTTGARSAGRIEIVAGLDGSEPVVRRVFELPATEDARGAPFLPRRR